MGVAHNQQIRVHRIQREGCVDQGFPFLDRACLHRHVHHICAKPFARQFETGLRAGGVLEEHVDLGQAGQSVRMLCRTAIEIDVAVCQVEQGGDLNRVKRFDPQKMSGAKGHVVSGLGSRI